MISTAEFRERWHSVESIRTQLEHIVSCGWEAIIEFFKLRSHDLSKQPFEMTMGPGGTYDIVVFPAEYYYGSGNNDSETWMIPLTAVLSGKQACLDYLAEERRKEIEKQNELGRAREQRDIEQRKAIFLKLKAEFEPPENAIVKNTDSVQVSSSS